MNKPTKVNSNGAGKEQSSPFDGMMFQDYAVRPGLLLVKPNEGLMVVGGIEEGSVKLPDETITFKMLRLHAVTNLTHVHKPPLDKLQDNNIRLPATFEEGVVALKTLMTPIKPDTNTTYQKREKKYVSQLANGSPHDLAQLLAELCGSQKGNEGIETLRDARNKVNFTEKKLMDKASSFLAQELSVGLGLPEDQVSDLIECALLKPQDVAEKKIEALKENKPDYMPYMHARDFRSMFGHTIDEAMKEAGEWSTNTTIGSSTNPRKTVEQPMPTDDKKTKTKQWHPSKENQAFYDRYINDVAIGGIVKKLFNVAAAVLDKKAFELHARMYCFPARKMTIMQAGNTVDLDSHQARILHDESVEKLRPHFGDVNKMRRVPAFLKKIYSGGPATSKSQDKKAPKKPENVKEKPPKQQSTAQSTAVSHQGVEPREEMVVVVRVPVTGKPREIRLVKEGGGYRVSVNNKIEAAATVRTRRLKKPKGP